MSIPKNVLLELTETFEKFNSCNLNDVYINLFSQQLLNLSVTKEHGAIILSPINDDIIYNKSLNIVKEILEIKGLSNIKIINQKKDIIIFFNEIIKTIKEMLEGKIAVFHKNDILLKGFTLTSYMLQLHQQVQLILHGRLTTYKIEGLDIVESSILNFIENNKFKVNKDINGILGKDKAILQYLIALTMSTPEYDTHLYTMNEKDFEYLYLHIYTLVDLISKRELITSKIFEEINMTVKDGEFIFHDKNWANILNEFGETFVDERISTPNEDFPDIINVLKKNFHKALGFNFDNLEKFITFEENLLPTHEKQLCYPFFKDYLTTLMMEHTDCKKEEAIKTINYYTLQPIKNKDLYFESIDKFEYRILEKPLVPIQIKGHILYLVSIPLLLNAINITYHKLIYNLIPECKKDNSKPIQKKVKNDLVLNIEDIIKNYTVNYQSNAKDFTIYDNEKQRKFSFTSEMDVIAIVNKTLLIIECKDLQYKFTPFGYRKDIQKALQYINEISSEMLEIKDNINIIQKYFNEEIKAIIPILVFKTHNIVINSPIDKKGVIITSLHKFEDTLKSLINQ
ncbi:hypothetical protein [Bacillus thuringiensis]|uniref:NERD domain-containing protein n=1 Tax=Bacillus thuringiensis serovar toumanoffi TaxID=180862 RepID=A0ABD5HR79_BACTU|nr:hypothetical protein [Bacillus thuringiensis]EEM95457.1 hypothetical protein bthur0013_32790 [Bacillus thuringiensis IBL 200]MCR6784056.1 hypothetical protein [Bacillus thuringiensis]MCR6861670.1 hypothetical protein [Bacillus thuringiensis]MCR6868528.1 hypothetical protein [Bacillus thuringiensis]MDW9207410.1 hypothetical protein [Bacillus thuringiensis serovar toumanoffi]